MRFVYNYLNIYTLLAALAIGLFFMSPPAKGYTYPEDFFECVGPLDDGIILVSGHYDETGIISDVWVEQFTGSGVQTQYFEFEMQFVTNDVFNEEWYVLSLMHGNALHIRHLEGTENQSYISVVIPEAFSYNTQKGSCYFY